MHGTCVRKCYDYDKCTFNSALNVIFFNHTSNAKTQKRVYVSSKDFYVLLFNVVTFPNLQWDAYDTHKNSVTISSKALSCVKCGVNVNVLHNIKNLYEEETTQHYPLCFAYNAVASHNIEKTISRVVW